MRQDVTELKKLVHEIMSERGAVTSNVGTFYTPAPVVAPTPSVPAIIHPVKFLIVPMTMTYKIPKSMWKSRFRWMKSRKK